GPPVGQRFRLTAHRAARGRRAGLSRSAHVFFERPQLRTKLIARLPMAYRAAAAVAPRGRRRATPVRMAASPTAAATAGTTRLSNIDGVMYSSLSSAFETIAASASAAASFISSLTRRARTSSIPRKKPGKQQELLIWFG